MTVERSDMSTVWVRKDTIDVLKQVATVLGAKSLDETMGRLVDHFRGCPGGLDPMIEDMQKRMDALRNMRLRK